MRIGTRARYSLRLMLAVGKLECGNHPVSLPDIARLTGISKPYLDQLVVMLRNAGLLRSRSGKGGGYTLGRPADRIRIGEVIQAAIGPLSVVECVAAPETCVHAEFCACLPLWTLVNRRIVGVLDDYSLADLLTDNWPLRIQSELAALKGAGDRLRERSLAAAFEHSPCPIAVVGADNRISSANQAFLETFGSWAGRTCHELYKGRAEPCQTCVAVDALERGAKVVSHEEGRRSDGRPMSYEVHAVPVGAEPDRQALLVSLDTTPLRRLEREVRQSERLARVGLTTAGLAHSVKSILAGLEGGVYVVDSGLEKRDLERVEGGWEMVRAFIDQVSTLVQNLLRYASAQEPAQESVEPGSLVERVVELFASKAEMVGITIEARVDPALPELMLERETIQGCLANLVSNALDACTWDPDDSKSHRVVVTASPRPGGGVVYEVADNGMGISDANQGKVFDASFTTKGIRGTGLGLLLTKKAVEEHGGSVGFHSVAGRGATFRIELPPGE